MVFNITGGPGGVGANLTVYGVVGATVTAALGSKVKTRVIDSTGYVVFRGLEAGTWTLTMTKSGESPATATFVVNTDYTVTMAFRVTPEFTYTGDYKIVDDDDNVISESTWPTWKGNWKIRFLTSGTLKFINLHGYTGGA